MKRASWCYALVVLCLAAVPAGASERPFEEFVAAQGTYCIDFNADTICDYYFPPQSNFVGFIDPYNDRSILVDYAGLAGGWLRDQSSGSIDCGTAMDGVVHERELPDGRAEIQVDAQATRALVEPAMEEAKEILEYLGLFGRWKWFASQLSYGEQKRLEIARALAAKPDLLLLDEPAVGLPYPEAKQLAENLRHLREAGLTLLMIEHHMGMVMEIADEVAVLNNGELLAEGPPDLVKSDPLVIEAYMLKK